MGNSQVGRSFFRPFLCTPQQQRFINALTALHHSLHLHRLLQPPVNKSGQVVGTATAAVASGTKIFTDLGFEAGSAALQLPRQHMFAATASGAVFQIDYARCADGGRFGTTVTTHAQRHCMLCMNANEVKACKCSHCLHAAPAQPLNDFATIQTAISC
jgi:hypothetical protein